LDRSTLDWLIDHIVGEIAEGERVSAAALQLLLRCLSAADRIDLSQPLGAALALELHHQDNHGHDVDPEGWLVLFSEASAASDDERLPRAAARLLPGVQAAWTDPAVDVAMRAIDASLLSVNIAEARNLAAAAIDTLERIVSGAYRPGEGIAHLTGTPTFSRGGLADHVRSASALMTAYMLADRLPYAMLADELMQSVLRTPQRAEVPFALECDAARVFCRLAALHRDREYQRTAVLPVGGDYAESARRTLEPLVPSVRLLGVRAAPFGLALAEWLDLQ
jgi:hypothetical protein